VLSALLVTATRVYGEALQLAFASLDARAEIAATSTNADDAVSALRDLRRCGRCDLILIQLPQPRGLVAARALRMADSRVPLLAFDVPDDERQVVAWAQAGVQGCVAADSSLADLLAAAESVTRGEAVCSPVLAGALFRRAAHSTGDGALALHSPLTPRELDVFQLLANGLSNKQIAAALQVQLSTVKNHIQSIYKKTNVRRRSDLLRCEELIEAGRGRERLDLAS
jgi:DNA-binding NarL/FixJ family response regulator